MVKFTHDGIRINGVERPLYSGSIHYWRTRKKDWRHVLSQIKGKMCIRDREGDPWAPVVGGAEDADPNFAAFTEGLRSGLYRQNLANRTRVTGKDQYPLVKTFDKGLEFLRENEGKDSFFLQIESFSPHEPFMASREFKDMYPGKAKGKKYEWPDYAPVKESAEEADEIKYSYFADLTMCDEQLGRLLDYMDEKNLWEDKMCIRDRHYDCGHIPGYLGECHTGR